MFQVRSDAVFGDQRVKGLQAARHTHPPVVSLPLSVSQVQYVNNPKLDDKFW